MTYVDALYLYEEGGIVRMINTPVNVEPHNTAISLSSNNNVELSFVFKGDIANNVIVEFCGDRDNSFIGYGVQEATLYNDNAHSILSTDLSAYIGAAVRYNFIFCQGNATPICDMFIGNAKLYSNVNSGATTIRIDSNLDYIYNFATNNTSTKTPIQSRGVDATVIIAKMANEQPVKVISYDKSNGTITLETGLTSSHAMNETIQLYSNYLKTRPYYVEINSAPILDIQVRDSLMGYVCTGTYSQAEDVFLKSFHWHITAYGDNVSKRYDSERTYSQNILYSFPNDYIDVNENSYTFGRMLCSCTVEANNGLNISKAISVAEVTYTGEEILESYSVAPSNETGRTRIHWKFLDWNTAKYYWSAVRIYRIDIETNETQYIGVYRGAFGDNTQEDYPEGESPLNILNEDGIDDVTAANGRTYKYIILPATPANEQYISIYNFVKGIPHTEDVSFNVDGWTITAIYPMTAQYKDGTSLYYYGDTWKFIGDISNVTVTQNTGRELHTSNDKYPVQTETETNYASGNFEALLSQIICPDSTHFKDDIELVQAWRKFITQHCSFILKSIKGDVWVVNVDNAPSTTYTDGEKFTTISFNWNECADVKDITVYKRTVEIGRYDRLGG